MGCVMGDSGAYCSGLKTVDGGEARREIGCTGTAGQASMASDVCMGPIMLLVSYGINNINMVEGNNGIVHNADDSFSWYRRDARWEPSSLALTYTRLEIPNV